MCLRSRVGPSGASWVHGRESAKSAIAASGRRWPVVARAPASYTNILNGILEVAQAVEGAAAITATAVSIMGTLNAQTYAATAAGSAVLASRV